MAALETPLEQTPQNQTRPRIRFNFWAEGWSMMKSDLPAYLMAGCWMSVIIAGSYWLQISDLGARNYHPPRQFLPPPLTIAGMLTGQIVIAGYYRLTVNHIRRGKARAMDFYLPINRVPAVLVVAVIELIVVYLASACCLLPGLFLTGLLMFTKPLVLDQHLGPIPAIKRSVQILWPQAGRALLLVILMNVASVSGALALGAGLLITVPLGFMGAPLAYRDLVLAAPKEAVGATPLTSPPIADPGS